MRGHVPTSQYWTAGQDTREELSWAACRHAAQGNIIMRHHQDNTLVCRNQLKVHYLVQLLGSHNQRNHCIVIVLLCGWSSSDRQTDRQVTRRFSISQSPTFMHFSNALIAQFQIVIMNIQRARIGDWGKM